MPPTLLYSPLLTTLQIPHAFTTRQGGISTGIFNSLNFGNPSDLPAADRDPPTNIKANFIRVLQSLNATGRELVEVHQIHGSQVHTILRNQPSHATPHDTKADAIVTNDPARILAIRIADCTPVLLSSQDGKIVAIAHAGWRGVIAGIIPNTIRTMQKLGAQSITAAIGPCISLDHFQVGQEVAEQFIAAFGPSVIRATDSPVLGLVGADHPSLPATPNPHVNLKRSIELQLQRERITQIDTLPHCTYRDHNLFFSHRRDKGRTGRMVALIGPR